MSRRVDLRGVVTNRRVHRRNQPSLPRGLGEGRDRWVAVGRRHPEAGVGERPVSRGYRRGTQGLTCIPWLIYQGGFDCM